MSELKQAREHLKRETVRLLEAVVLKDMQEAEAQTIVVISLIHHIKRIEARNAATDTA
jgi:hypothetical protein